MKESSKARFIALLRESDAKRFARFWSVENMDGWPSDADGYEFLGNAALKVGRALFQEVWRGRDPLEWVSRGDKISCERMAVVIRTMHSSATRGQLKLATRPVDEFLFSPLLRVIWKSEGEFAAYLRECQMRTELLTARRPFPKKQWIFVTSESLNAMLGSVRLASVPSVSADADETSSFAVYPDEQVVSAIEHLVALWREDKGRRYGRDALYDILSEKGACFAGISTTRFRAAWNSASRPSTWKGRLPAVEMRMPDTATGLIWPPNT